MDIHLQGKKLLIQGAGRSNLGLIKTAKSLGVQTIVTSMGGDYPCIPYADKECYADITDPDAIVEIAKKEKIDGIIICCSDTGLKAVGRCNDILHLQGISEEAATLSSNKLLMKEKLVQGGVRTARYQIVKNKTDLISFVDSVGLPVIIKAVDLQGSRGIYIVRDYEELEKCLNHVMASTKQGYCIVEEFIVGTEFGAQAFVYKGEVLFVLPHGDETVSCMTPVPIGHYMPYDVPQPLQEDIILQVKNAIKAIGLDNCAVNVDLIEKSGKVYVIELTGRVGANCLPEIVSNYLGINYYEMILLTCLNNSPLPILEASRKKSATMSKMITSLVSGVVKRISYTPCVDTEVQFFVKEGDRVRSFTNCNDAIGEVVAKGKTLVDCQEKIQQLLNGIQITLE